MDFNNLHPLIKKLAPVAIIALLLIVLLLSKKPPIAGIYEGIIPAPDGQVKDVSAFIYPNGKCYIKTVYFKKPNETNYELCRWERKKNTLIIFPNETSETYYLRIMKNTLVLLDKQGRIISDSDPGLRLYKLADI